jgi:hypothetical protein
MKKKQCADNKMLLTLREFSELYPIAITHRSPTSSREPLTYVDYRPASLPRRLLLKVRAKVLYYLGLGQLV